MMDMIGNFFGWLMNGCYKIIPGYGWAIIVFTLLSKIILLPISIMVQFNSIKMVKMYPDMNRIKAKYYGSKDLIAEENYKLYHTHNYHPVLDIIPVIVQLIILMGVVEGIKKFTVADTMFLGLNLGVVPSKSLGTTILIPVIAAVSAWLMCWTQNMSNVLQSEQNKVNQITTMSISVGLSLYLGFFVQGGVGLYWIAGNLLSIVQMYALNFFINPKKYIDYEALNESKEELEKVVNNSVAVKKKQTPEETKREKEDYKRFDKYGTKQIVFYSEHNGFYKYYKDIIEYILKKTDIDIHYICSDYNDVVLEQKNEHFHTYYIGENKLIVLMMKMDADIVVMTTPDLQKYHLKRSIIRDDIEYIYIDHGMNSLNMVLRKHAIDYFDTIMAANDCVYEEIRAQEKTYNLKEKNIVKYGYCLVDNMMKAYVPNEKEHTPTILIGPSWQPDNIMDLCIEDILDELCSTEYNVIVRPHPQYVRHFSDKLEILKQKYATYKNIELQTDFSSNKTVYDADILITDWSGIAYEYSLSTLKPTLFIDTPMKVMNPDYKEIGVEPFDVVIRNEIGIAIVPDEIVGIKSVIEKLLHEDSFSREAMSEIREKYLYNVGSSAEVGAKYIIKRLIEMSKK